MSTFVYPSQAAVQLAATGGGSAGGAGPGPEAEGACGGSASQHSMALTRGGQIDVSESS